MSKIETILVLSREDLHEFNKTKIFQEIDYSDFKGSAKQFHTEPFVIFIDTDMSTKLLKNRYGNDGTVK